MLGTKNFFDFSNWSAGGASTHRARGGAPVVGARVLRPGFSKFIKEDAATVFIGIKIDGLTADGAGCIGIDEAARVACCTVAFQRLRRMALFILGVDRPKCLYFGRDGGTSTVSVTAANAPPTCAPRVMIVSGQFGTKIPILVAEICIINAHFGSPLPQFLSASKHVSRLRSLPPSIMLGGRLRSERMRVQRGSVPARALCALSRLAAIPRTRQVAPPGPRGRPRSSERDLVVAVDQLGVFVLSRLRAAQEVDLLGDDLAAVAVVAHAVDPLAVVDAAMDEDLHALFAVLGRPSCRDR